jgi:hypothetical protein
VQSKMTCPLRSRRGGLGGQARCFDLFASVGKSL